MDILKADIRSMVQSYDVKKKGSYTIEQLEKDFKAIRNDSIQFKSYGFDTLENFLKSMPDVVKVTPKGQTCIITHVPHDRSQHVRRLMEQSKNYRSRGNGASKQLKDCKTPVTNKQKDNKFSFYEDDNNRDDDLQFKKNVSFTMNSDLQDEEESLPPINVVQKDEQQENKLNDSLVMFKNILNKTKISKDVAVPSFEHCPSLIIFDAPSTHEACSLEDVFQPAKIPASLAVGKEYQLFVTEVHNPHRFWVHLDDYNQLDNLMDDIEQFYNNKKGEWRIPQEGIIKGMVCAAKYDGYYHRAKIIGNVNDGTVKVYYVDYGTVHSIPIRHVKYLGKQFLALRECAQRASLAYTVPSAMTWTRDATRAMIELVENKSLMGKVIAFDPEYQVVFLVLKSNMQRQASVNQMLFIKGHSKFDEKAYVQNNNNHNYFHDRPKSYPEAHPMFDDLETGQAASFDEIGKMSDKIDVEDFQISSAFLSRYNCFKKYFVTKN